MRPGGVRLGSLGIEGEDEGEGEDLIERAFFGLPFAQPGSGDG
jgi:hypothetical protein